MQARWGTHGDHPIIAIAPATVKEIFVQTIKAFNFSEKYRVPVILLLDEIIAHMREKIEIPPENSIELWTRPKPTEPPEKYLPYEQTASLIPPMAEYGSGYRFHVTGLCYDETGFPTNNPKIIGKLLWRINTKLSLYLDEILQWESILDDDAEVMVFSYGSTARSAKSAVRIAREKGMKVGHFRPITIWPFPEEAVRKMSEKVRHIIVAELNFGQIVFEVERLSCKNAEVSFVGRYDGDPMNPGQILSKIEEVY
jgi:2-oxoglutarate ferredoxin oxidoreductase subunit alpha